LLSLPVLAGIIIRILPAINSVLFWKELNVTQSARYEENLNLSFLRIFRDYMPEYMCHYIFYVNKLRLFSSSPIKMLNNIDSLNKLDPLINKNFKFLSYLAGLIEGDGTIIIPKIERSFKGKLYYPSLQIAFDLRDLPLAIIIQQKLKHGSL
jgi:hypothetical protein